MELAEQLDRRAALGADCPGNAQGQEKQDTESKVKTTAPLHHCSSSARHTPKTDKTRNNGQPPKGLPVEAIPDGSSYLG